MTKEDLDQYRKLQREITSLERKLDKLYGKEVPVVSGKVTASSVDFPYTEYRVGVLMEDPKVADELDQLIRIREQRLERCRAMTLKIEQFVDQIDDSELRQIFEHRFIEGLKLREIAALVHLDLSVVGKKITSYLELANNAKKSMI